MSLNLKLNGPINGFTWYITCLILKSFRLNPRSNFYSPPPNVLQALINFPVQSKCVFTLQHVMRFAELTQEVQIARSTQIKHDHGLAPGRRKMNQEYRDAAERLRAEGSKILFLRFSTHLATDNLDVSILIPFDHHDQRWTSGNSKYNSETEMKK